MGGHLCTLQLLWVVQQLLINSSDQGLILIILSLYVKVPCHVVVPEHSDHVMGSEIVVCSTCCMCVCNCAQSGSSALHISISAGHAEACAALLGAGADVNQTDNVRLNNNYTGFQFLSCWILLSCMVTSYSSANSADRFNSSGSGK